MQSQAPLAARPRFTVLREKLEIRHTDPVHRRLCLHMHLRFDGPLDTRAGHFMIVLERYLPGLQVRDDEGRELSFLPYAEIRKILGVDPESIIGRKLADRAASADEPSLLYILFPEPLEINEVFVLRLHYEDDQPPSRVENFPLIRAPPFTLSEVKEHESWNTFIEIHAPVGSEVVVDQLRGIEEGEAFQDRHRGYRNFKSFVQVRARARAPTPLAFRYRVKPFLSERILLYTTYAMMLLLPTLFFAATVIPPFELPVAGTVGVAYPPAPTFAQTVGAVGVPAMLAIIALAPATSINRLWYFLPLAFFTTLLLWTGP